MSTDTNSTTFEVERQGSFDEEFLLSQDIRVISRNGNLMRLMYKHQLFDVVVRSFDPASKQATINVAGSDFNVKAKGPLDKLIDELGFLKAGKHSVKEIKSPMPGLVVQLFVKEGETVLEGDKLLSLEAMKMENILKSPGSGTIKSIRIQKGNSVDKNQILIDFE